MPKKKVEKEKHEIEIQQKNNLIELEQFYTEGKIDNILANIATAATGNISFIPSTTASNVSFTFKL